MLRIRPWVLFATSCALALSVAAQAAPPTKAEQVLKYRKSLYQVMAWNFGPMSAMAQGKMPYDAKEFALRADRVATIAPMLAEAFPPDSKGVANSELKPEMWANRADFDAKMKDLVDKSAALAAAAKTGDFAKSKAAFFDTGNACKNCHDKYKHE
ncbi:MAG TPA: cytochrome c [Steroidobacteraceae bacterium]